MREKEGEVYKEKGKCNIESRIEFTVPKLVSLDTPHGPITKFLKKSLENAGKKDFFPTFFCLIQN